ncbi:MAG: hypothetical protein RSD35_08125 [Oscillospiraceae bacterium]
MRDTEKRMASGYEITQAIHIGDKEVVFGVDDKNEFDLKYICAYYKSNELLGEYSDCMASADYVEIMQLFANRLSEQCDMVRTEQERVTVPMEMITAEQCVPDDYKKNIEGKVIVICPEVLRDEYQTADRQLWLCTGGFGSDGNSRGSACFCINLYSGKETRWERRDVMGEMKELPDWAKERLAAIQSQRQKAAKEREDR